jgi:hypothetical protein
MMDEICDLSMKTNCFYYLSERFITNDTSVWFFSSMHERMLPQIAICMKSFPTFGHYTTIRPRVTVDPHMNLKSGMRLVSI